MLMSVEILFAYEVLNSAQSIEQMLQSAVVSLGGDGGGATLLGCHDLGVILFYDVKP